MNAFLYLQKLIGPSIEILRTSPNYSGDLSFYFPNYNPCKKLDKNPNIKNMQNIDGFWNITFTKQFWNSQLIDFLQRPYAVVDQEFSKKFWPTQFINFYESLLKYYKTAFGKQFIDALDKTPDLTNPQDLAIIKDIIHWEYRHIVLKNNSQNTEMFIQSFYDWWRSHKIKGSLLRIIDPKDIKKTNERMLIPTAYHKILKDLGT